MWVFEREENGILFFTKGQSERNLFGTLSEVETLIAQWQLEDEQAQEETE